jgi:CO/xanthine dehydrogenase FAD-binding subunit
VVLRSSSGHSSSRGGATVAGGCSNREGAAVAAPALLPVGAMVATARGGTRAGVVG